MSAAEARGTAGRGWRFWLGLGLLLAGIAVLAYVVWEIYGTDVVSKRRHRDAVEALHAQWSRPDGGGDVATGHGTATAVIRVPTFGSDYAVPILEGTDDDALASGLGHLTGSAEPGEKGNFALAGHRVTHGEPLRDMPSLDVGDTVVIETRAATYTYVLDTAGDDLRVPFTAGWVLDPAPVNPEDGVGPDPDQRRLITLTTCAELFHTDDRLVAFGHLESTDQRPDHSLSGD